MQTSQLCTHGVPKSSCAKCWADYMRAWYHANPERAKANSKASRDRHREQRRADNREHYKKNSDAYKARAVEWKAAHRGKVLKGSRRYRREMREQRPRELSCRNLNEGARRRGATNAITLAEYDAVVRASGGYCFWCDGQLSTWGEFDHPVPLRLKGEHSASNLVLACRSCNKRKNYKHPSDFDAERWLRFQQLLTMA